MSFRELFSYSACISTADVVDGVVEVCALPSRDLVVRWLVAPDGESPPPPLLLRPLSFEGTTNEARFLAACQQEPLRERFSSWLLRPLRYPTTRGTKRLYLRWLDDAKPLWSSAGSLVAPSLLLGKALGTLHAFVHLRDFDPPLPPAGRLEFHPRDTALSPVYQQGLEIIDGEKIFTETLSQLHDGFDVADQGTVIHGKVRKGNVLRHGEQILLVDWTDICRGDPARDVGSALAAFALTRLLGRDPESFQAAAQAFWQSYLETRETSMDAEFPSRVMRYSALYLALEALGLTSGRERLPRRALEGFQLAANLLADLPAASSTLYGIDLGDRP